MTFKISLIALDDIRRAAALKGIARLACPPPIMLESIGQLLTITPLLVAGQAHSLDQRTGTKVGREPLRTLATYRRASQGGVAFGVKFSVVGPGKLAVGDNMDR